MIDDIPNWIWVLWGPGYADMSMLPHVTPSDDDSNEWFAVWMVEMMDSYPINDDPPTIADVIAWLSGLEVWY